MSRVAPYYKAVVGALTAFLTGISAGLVDGSLSTSEWLTAVVALLIAGGAVFTIPNRARSTDDPSTREKV